MPWSQYEETMELSEMKERLETTETGRHLLGQHYHENTDGDDNKDKKVVLAKLLYAIETGCHVRTDGMYYCGHLVHQDGLGNVYMRFHPDGFAAMTKVFTKDPNVVFHEDLTCTGSKDDTENNTYKFNDKNKMHKFHYTCQLLSPGHARYDQDLFEIIFTPINQTAISWHEAYGAHPNGYIRIEDGQFSHEYTDHNWTHTRTYNFAQAKLTAKKDETTK